MDSLNLLKWLSRFVQQNREAAELAQLNECELGEIRATRAAAEQAQNASDTHQVNLLRPGKHALQPMSAKADDGESR